MKNNVVKGTLSALIANTIFGFSFLFSKIALGFADSLVILSVRFTIAFLVLNILWAFGAIKLDFKGKPKKKIVLMAVAQPLLYFIFELYGIENTSSALSGVLISLVPVVVLILSTVFLKEKPTLKQVIFSAISLFAVAGISLLSNDGGVNRIVGILLLFGAVICAAVFNVLSRSESKHYSAVEKTYMMFLIGTVGFNIISLLVFRGNYINEFYTAFSSIEFWGAIIYLAVLSSVAAFMLYNYSTSVISSVKAASFANIVTIVSVVGGILILGESFSIGQIICCILIIIGVFGVNK